MMDTDAPHRFRAIRSLSGLRRFGSSDPTLSEVGLGLIFLIWAVLFLPAWTCMTCRAQWSGMVWLPEWLWGLAFTAGVGLVLVGQWTHSRAVRIAAMGWAALVWPAVLVSLLWVNIQTTSWVYLVVSMSAWVALLQLRRSN
jgi:hypothetical protein